ncbi:MAG: alpha/beta hydrolase [Sphingomonadaceae bacterium]|nr:alpha/beta hydrolase [Sphingomonadaceae bacterium]
MTFRLAASVLALALSIGTPALSQQPIPVGEAVEIGRTYAIDSRVLGGQRRISVRLPAEHASDPQRRFPVVYVIDGGPEQDFPHIAGIAQSREVNGTFVPFILVGIETVNRRHEITPPATDVAAYQAELGAAPGGAETFRRFIREDVKPWVAQRYRTNGRDAVMGESLAGLFVIETLFREPSLFDDYIAVSPSLWWEDMLYGRSAATFLDAIPPGDRRLYLTLADEGYRHEQGVALLVEALRRDAPEGLQWLYVPQGDHETHASIYHGAALDAFRAFYGEPTRLYRPGPLLSGQPLPPRTAAHDALMASECARETSRRATPADTRGDHDALFYECQLYDLGPRATVGNFER